MTEITKNIHLISDHAISAKIKTTDQAIDALITLGDPVVTEETFNIFHNIPTNNTIPLARTQLAVAGKLSFQMSERDVSRIIGNIVQILRSPRSIAKHLHNLNHELGLRMAADGIHFSEADLPQYLIAGKCHFIAGPKPENYVFRKKNYLLDKLLLEREMADGINVEGYSAEFSGFIPFGEANKFVLDGHLFSENEQVDNTILHGKYSHRLAFEIFREAQKSGDLNLELSNGHKLTTKELLEFMVKVKIGSFEDKPSELSSVWAHLMDCVDDSVYLESSIHSDNLYEDYYEMFDPDNYSYSARNPAVFKAMLTCFGRELGLSNLQHYLLDSQWKQMEKIITRAKENDTAGILTGISDTQIATNCIKIMVCDLNPPNIVSPNPLTIRADEIDRSKKRAFGAEYDDKITVKTRKLAARTLSQIGTTIERSDKAISH